ncbi:MAG: ABC transporter permease [Bacteriovoracaceae bacterium]
MTLAQYWIQVQELTMASVKSRYRRTFAGFIWVLLNPILQFGVQCLVFKQFLKLNIPNYYLFLLGGLLPWIFITSTLSMGTPVFVAHAHLLRSFKISPMVILCSQILDNFINFLASVVIILLPVYLISGQPLLSLLGLPLAIIPLLVMTASVTIILSTLNVFYRDINFVIGFMMSLLFFLTPVFYPREYVPAHFQWIIDVNPFVYIIEPFRALFIRPSWEDFFFWVLKGSGVAGLSAFIAFWTFKRRRNDFYFRL